MCIILVRSVVVAEDDEGIVGIVTIKLNKSYGN